MTVVASRGGRRRILVTRPAEDAAPLLAALAARGLSAISVPTIAVEPTRDPAALLRAVTVAASESRWVVVTSPNGARAATGALGRSGRPATAVRWAAVGLATAEVLRSAGADGVWHPTEPHGGALAREIPLRPGEPVLVARSDVADRQLVDTLAARGARVDEVVAYRTVEGPDASRGALAQALEQGIDAVVLASGSAARGLLRLAGREAAGAWRAVPAVCIGRTTATVAREHGFTTILVSPGPEPGTIADLCAATVSSGAPALP